MRGSSVKLSQRDWFGKAASKQSFSLEQLNSSRNARESISSMGSLAKSLGRHPPLYPASDTTFICIIIHHRGFANGKNLICSCIQVVDFLLS